MDNLMQYLPRYYGNSAVMAAVLLPHENEMERILAKVRDTEKQMILSEATHALDRYEQDLGIDTNPTESYEVRRSRILAKLRGMKTITRTALTDLVKTYIDGIVTVEEHPAESTVDIRFVTRKGIPGTMEDIEKAVEEVIPAHLYVNYIFTYRTWADVEAFIGRWDDVAAYTWDGLSTKEILQNLFVDQTTRRVFYRPANDGNATLIFDTDGRPYARLYEGV